MASVEQLMEQYGLHWFKFNETSGNAVDSKGSAIGTVYSDVRRIEGWDGEGGAVKFIRNTNSYIGFNSKIIPNGSYSFRIKMKFFNRPSVESQEILSNSFSTGSQNGLRVFINTSGLLYFTSLRSSEGNYDFDLNTPADFDGKWHDYLFHWDTVNKMARLYKDEILIAEDSTVTINNLTATYNLRLGKQADGNRGRFFEGEVDDFQVYSTVLTPDDFNKKYLAIENQDGEIYSFTSDKTRIKKLSSKNKNLILEQGLEWLDIFNATSSNELSLISDMNVLEVISNINTNLGNGIYFTINVDNFNRISSEEQNVKYLILNDDKYKYHDGLLWQETFLTEENFIQYGMEQLSQITEVQWQELSGDIAILSYTNDNEKDYSSVILDKPTFNLSNYFKNGSKILIASNENLNSPLLHLGVEAKNQIVLPKNDISLFGVDVIDSIKVTATGDGKVAISNDSGVTWKSYVNDAWINVTDASEGMTYSELNSLNSTILNQLINKDRKIKFSYYLTQDSQVDSIQLFAYLAGKEELADTSKYTVDYDVSRKTIIYNIKTSGTYTFNVYDPI